MHQFYSANLPCRSRKYLEERCDQTRKIKRNAEKCIRGEESAETVRKVKDFYLFFWWNKGQTLSIGTWASCTVGTCKLPAESVQSFNPYANSHGCVSNNAAALSRPFWKCLMKMWSLGTFVACWESYIHSPSLWSTSKHCMCLVSVCVHSVLVAGLPRVPNTSFPFGVPRQCHNRPASSHFLILLCLRSIHGERVLALFSNLWTRVSVSRFLLVFHRC